MSVDNYAGAAARWASGAMLVYGPIAAQLVARSPHPLRGRRVLDAGTGTGAASAVLLERGARVVAADLSAEMLASGTGRPAGAVADVRALPFATASVDDCVAAFVLNHLVDPQAGFAELLRVTRRGGAVLVTVLGTANSSPVRDRIDAVAVEAGWVVPEWYVHAKSVAIPLLGDAAAMDRVARECGLVDVDVEETPVDVGVTRAEELVDYRFGQAHFAGWLNALGPERAAAVRNRAVDTIRPVMEPYRPIVVFLRARTP